MVEHRRGLNRTLFWLYMGGGKWPHRFRWAMLAFDFVTIGLFLFHPVLSLRGHAEQSTGVWIAIDIFIAIVITTDVAARFYIERHKWRFFLRPTNVADVVVAATLIVPVMAQNFTFLRVLRVLRLVRAFQFIDQYQTVSKWLHFNSAIVEKVVNLTVFVFITTALVYVSQVSHNAEINSYLDALYFTMSSLTTTGYGDIVLEGAGGRWLSVAMMILGVTLFLQLIRAIAIGDKLREKCPRCELNYHDRDAAHCKRCGANLFESAVKD